MVGVAPVDETLVTIVTWDGIIVVGDLVAGETSVTLINDEALLVTWDCITSRWLSCWWKFIHTN